LATTNAGTSAYEVFGTSSPVTGAAPTDATDGQPLKDLDGITVQIAAASPRTLSGAGSLDCYVYDAYVALWARMPAFDFSVTGTTRTMAFPAYEVVAPRGARIKWVPTGVTFSAGSAGVTVFQLGFSKLSKGQY
jgi:hypothetical protein